MKKRSLALVVSLAMSACTSSRQPPASPVELKHFSLDSMEGVVRPPELASTRRCRLTERVLCGSTPASR